MKKYFFVYFGIFTLIFIACTSIEKTADFNPKFKLLPAEKIKFNSFVDCNMAEVWVGDTFRIFPGKYGEDPLWGYAKDLKYADGKSAEETFKSKSDNFHSPIMPKNVLPT